MIGGWSVTFAAAGLAGLVVLTRAGRVVRPGPRALLLAAGTVLVAAPLAELGTRLAWAAGLVGPAADGPEGDLYADEVVADGVGALPRHLLPDGDRRPGHAPAHARLVVVGDSFTHGDGVRPSETFAAGLADRVRPADGRPVQVVNLGLSSLDLTQAHALYLGYGHAWVPDVVVWVFVPNDLGGGTPGAEAQAWGDLVVARDAPRRSGSALVDLVATTWRARRLEAAVVESYRSSFSDAALDRAEAQLRDVAEAVSSQGGRLLVVTFPLLWQLDTLPFADLHARLLARAERAGAETLDLGPTFAGLDPATLWVSARDHHPNARAHALAADAIAAAIGTQVPAARPAPCHPGAGEPLRRLCEAPTAERAAEVAEAFAAAGHPTHLHLVERFARVYAWHEAAALPGPERDAVRARVRPPGADSP